MKIGYGKSRIIVYMLVGAGMAGLIMVAHELMEHFQVPYHNIMLAVFIPLIGTGMALLARRENAIYQRKEELDEARRRINDLMMRAIDKRGHGTVLEEDSLATCWKELDCDQEDCPVYGREHARCWLMAGTFCRGQVQGKFAKKLEDCRLCEIYQKATGDPVSEITENFYAMDYLLGEREEQLERAFNEARDRSEKLAGLVTLSEVALSSVHLADLLENLLASAAALVGADFGFVSLADSEEANLTTRVTFGLDISPDELSSKVGEGIIGQAYAGGYIAVSEDIATDTRVINPFLKESGARTLISLPLVGRERPLGMLTLGTITVHHYTDEEKDSLCVAADHIAVTVENALLEVKVGSGKEQLELLMAANRDLGTGGGVENVYQSFIANARRLVDYDRASLMFLNPDASEVEIVAADSTAPRTWLQQGIRLPLQALPMSRIVETGLPVIRSEIEGDEFATDKLMVEEGISSEVILPLVSEGRVLGSFNLGSFQAGAYSEEDVELLLPMARQLGTIINNARLLQDIKRFDFVDKLTKLYNHRFFFEALSREISRSRREEKPLTVMILDVAGFKEFNRMASRAEGDRILKGVAEVLKTTVRDIDIAARYGGAEFAVMLPGASTYHDGGGENEVLRIAERIQGEIFEKVLKGRDTQVTTCVGISEYPVHATDPMTLLERADWAVREARSSGDKCVLIAPVSDAGAGPPPEL